MSVTSLLAEIEKIASEAKSALPALEALQSVLAKVKPIVPAADQALFAEGETALAALIAVLSKA